MTKCHKCGTGWTSQGLPLCPICGARVESAAPSTPSPSRESVIEAPPMLDFVRKPANGSAVVEAPGVLPERSPAESKDAPPPRAEEAPALPASPPETRNPESRRFDLLRLADPSATALPAAGILSAPSRPLRGPLILGLLSYMGVLLFPLSIAFESHRVLGVLGFCMAGFFAPFAPIAWLAGLSAEKRRRDQGLRPERPVSLGRLLGQWGTLLLVSEVTLALIGIAALRLSGRFPISFWAPIY